MAQKKIADLTLRSSFDDTCQLPVDDATQTYRVTGAQLKTKTLADVAGANYTTLATPHNHGLLLSGSAQAMSAVTPDASTTKVLVSGGSSADPAWAAIPFPAMAAYTPTFTGLGTVSNLNARYLTWGNLTLVQGYVTSGTSTATEARMTLPNSLSSVAGLPTVQMCGAFTYDAFSGPQGYMLIEASKSYFTFGLSYTGLAGLSKLNGNTMVSSGTSISFWALVQTS